MTAVTRALTGPRRQARHADPAVTEPEDERLMEGHLRVTRELMAFLTPDQKVRPCCPCLSDTSVCAACSPWSRSLPHPAVSVILIEDR